MDTNPPPAWVQKRGGRLEPFDADKISRALFAASESLGRPDAFLARELTDGVVHFLTQETDDGAPTTMQIGELVVKVVRELGQPAVAAAFAENGLKRERDERTPDAAGARQEGDRLAAKEIVYRFSAGAPLDDVLAACLRSYSLQTVFARDLVSAHNDGLLTLTGLEAPGELAACVVGQSEPDGVAAAVERARRLIGDLVVFDGPEYLPFLHGPEGDRLAAGFVRELAVALRLARRDAVVNLNCAAPPPWAGEMAEGPLFSGRPSAAARHQLTRIADGLLAEMMRLEAEAGRIQIDWHLCEADFRPGAADRLAAAAQLALSGRPIGFVFDRPRRPVRLAAGVNRLHPAALLTIGLNLPRLAEQPGVGGDAERFLKKLGSLARLALSAAVQKRYYLRRQLTGPGAADVTSGFLLDRARLVVAPNGLDAAVRRFTGIPLFAGGAALDLGKRVLQTLCDVLKHDGGRTRLAACLDGPEDFRFVEALTVLQAAGRKPLDDASATQKLRVAGTLHAVAEGGTEAFQLPQAVPASAQAAVQFLRLAWKQGDVGRIRLFRMA
ncbi:MAG TPA: ATP cone domain-containing protein [Gemmataceae bacterium]|nr:ATP cone domain-containing protein [Gemmataceae bacterium]